MAKILRTAPSRQTGLSLTELIISMGLAMVMMMMAVPGYQFIVSSAQRSSVVTEVGASLMYARGEAIKRGTGVFLCPGSVDGGCAEGARPDWNHGWLVFEDRNGNRAYDGAQELLRAHQFAAPLYTLQGHGGVSHRIGFSGSGAMDKPGSLTYCDYDGRRAVTLHISAIGRFRVEERVDCEAAARG